jgi:hypothetical protein
VIAYVTELGVVLLYSYGRGRLTWPTEGSHVVEWAITKKMANVSAMDVKVSLVRRAADPYSPTLEELNAHDAIPWASARQLRHIVIDGVRPPPGGFPRLPVVHDGEDKVFIIKVLEPKQGRLHDTGD